MWKRIAVAVGFLCAALARPAAADIGQAPVGPSGTYVSLEGGYLLQDSDDVVGYGIITTTGGPIHDIDVSPDDGWFAGGTIGFNATSLIGSMGRVELYLLYGTADDEQSDAAPPLADIVLKSVDGSPLVCSTCLNPSSSAIGGLRGHTSIERDTWEGGFRLEGDNRSSATTTVTWVFAPFVRNMDEGTNTFVSGCCTLTRTSDVETWLYGVTFAAEPEIWLSSGIALVGRLGLGVYGYDANGKFVSFASLTTDPPFAARVSDDESGVGFRGQLGVGLKFRLSSTANLEAFSEADYFSDVGTAHIADNQLSSGDVSRVDTDDLWELRSGLRLNIGFGPGYPGY